MKIIRRHITFAAVMCLCILLMGISVSSSQAALVGDYTANSTATTANRIYSNSDQAEKLETGGVKAAVAAYLATLVAAYGAGYVVGRLLRHAVDAARGGDETIRQLGAPANAPLDFSQFDA